MLVTDVTTPPRALTSTLLLSGCSEMLMAKVVTDLANRTPGKEAVAMESFAKALRMVRTGSLLSVKGSFSGFSASRKLRNSWKKIDL